MCRLKAETIKKRVIEMTLKIFFIITFQAISKRNIKNEGNDATFRKPE